MSFLSKLRSNTTTTAPNLTIPQKGANAAPPSALDKHLAEITGPVQLDGSDKYFGFENYSSTCYCNSILQCLYFSAPFRNHVINFPPQAQADESIEDPEHATPRKIKNPLLIKKPPAQPGPLAVNSPARRPIVVAGTPQAQNQKVDEKDSPEWRKKILMQSVPMLDMQLDYSDTYGMQESLFTALKDIFETIISNDGRTGIVSPHKFLEILRKENEMFRSAMHQDAHEFLNLLLNQVVDTVEWHTKQQLAHLPTNGAKNGAVNGMTVPTAITRAATGWVHDLFEGLLVSETRCLTCETTSQRDEAFMDLSVDLDAHSSVTSCLRKFSEEEMLCERNKFHCDHCGGLQEAEKRMKIKRLPRILALHLKRFKYTEDYGRLQKLFHRVVYPFHLRLFNTTEDAEDQDRLYELYAVVVHIGGGPYHGHYVSIIKTQDRGWVLFDDELVEPVDMNYVQNFFGGEPKPGSQDAKQLACAYVLFYQETTMEAVEREQEAEAAAAAAAAAKAAEAAAVPVSPGQAGSLWGNGFKSLQSITTPTEERDDSFAHLSHSMTAPASFIPTLSTVPDKEPQVTLATSPPMASPPLKNKQDLKREEKDRKQQEKQAAKERKAAEKAAEKEAQKLSQQRTREGMERRRDLAKQQEAELQAAIEASRMSKAEEDARLSATVTNNTESTEGGEAVREHTAAPLRQSATESPSNGGIGSRFRTGSLSLRPKKPFWSGGRKSSAGTEDSATPLPLVRDEEDGAGEQAVVEQPAKPSGLERSASVAFGWKKKDDGAGDKEATKRNRFSMSRKKTVT